MAGPAVSRPGRPERGLASALLDFVWPSTCFGCGLRLGVDQHLGACARCWTRFHALPRTTCCPGCGLPAPATTDLLGPVSGRCAACRMRPGPVDAVIAAVRYDGHARRFLLRAKLGGHPELFRALAGQLVAVLAARRGPGGGALFVPVPSHPWVTLRRGFEPATEIARAVARARGGTLRRNLLRRRFDMTPVVKRLGASQRRLIATVAYRPRRGIPSVPLVLVDDVMTTGATLDACAAALKDGGAPRVDAVVWARAEAGLL